MDDLLQELQMLRESLAEKSGNRVLFSETGPANVAVIEAVVRSCCQLDRRVQLIAKAIERRYTLYNRRHERPHAYRPHAVLKQPGVDFPVGFTLKDANGTLAYRSRHSDFIRSAVGI